MSATAFATRGDEIVDGVLTCACSMSYPVVGTIPRMLSDAWEQCPEFRQQYAVQLTPFRLAVAPGEVVPASDKRTQESFGFQWTTFAAMVIDFRENFLEYLYPATPEFFAGKLGLDAGCGFGRHIFHAAQFGAEMVGVDFSRAIESSYQNTKHLPNVHLVQADIYALPFAPGTFDFAYSVGVLHHLPDPPRAMKAVARVVRDNGTFFVWLYSKKRKVANSLLETTRRLTTRMPHRLVERISLVAAAIDRYAFIRPYEVGRRLPILGSLVERATPPRIKLYGRYPFQVAHADWFDRLAAPIRFYYDEPEVHQLLKASGIADVQVSPTGLYGWRGCGTRRSPA